MGITSDPAEKGKGRWIRKIKSKPLWYPNCKDGIRIGRDRKDRASRSSSLEFSSSSDETESRCSMKKGIGEYSKAMDYGPRCIKAFGPKQGRLIR